MNSGQRKNDYMKRWHDRNQEHDHEYRILYRQHNLARERASNKAYRDSHKNDPRWIEKHREANRRRYRAKRRQIIKAVKDYRKTPEGALVRARCRSARRGLGAPKTILGRHLPHYQLHHLTKETAIYIPNALHNSIRHSLTKGRNMEAINTAAMMFYESCDA